MKIATFEKLISTTRSAYTLIDYNRHFIILTWCIKVKNMLRVENNSALINAARCFEMLMINAALS